MQVGGCSGCVCKCACVCVGTAACWQPSTSRQIPETWEQHSIYGLLKQLSTKELQAQPHMFHPPNQIPSEESASRVCVSPISQMGKCKAQHMKMSCFPTSLWPFGEGCNGVVCTKTRHGTMSYFQNKVLYMEPNMFPLQLCWLQVDLPVLVLSFWLCSVGTQKGNSLNLSMPSPILPLCFGYCKL